MLCDGCVECSYGSLAAAGTGVERVVGGGARGGGVFGEGDGGRGEGVEGHGEPGMPQDLLQGGAVGGTHGQALADQVSAFCKGTKETLVHTQI